MASKKVTKAEENILIHEGKVVIGQQFKAITGKKELYKKAVHLKSEWIAANIQFKTLVIQ